MRQQHTVTDHSAEVIGTPCPSQSSRIQADAFKDLLKRRRRRQRRLLWPCLQRRANDVPHYFLPAAPVLLVDDDVVWTLQSAETNNGRGANCSRRRSSVAWHRIQSRAAFGARELGAERFSCCRANGRMYNYSLVAVTPCPLLEVIKCAGGSRRRFLSRSSVIQHGVFPCEHLWY